MLVQQRLLHPLKTSVKISAICGRTLRSQTICVHLCNPWEALLRQKLLCIL